jgi:hypothetical protein
MLVNWIDIVTALQFTLGILVSVKMLLLTSVSAEAVVGIAVAAVL